MKNKIKILIFSLLLTNIAFSGNKDTIRSPQTFAEEQYILGNLDSLLNVWYIKNSIPEYWDTSATNTEIPVYSDSVIIEKLQKLPMIFELSYNDIVKKFIDLYTIKRRKQVEAMLGLSKYYFPIFESIFDSYNIPVELKYLSIIESALNPRVVSRAGATGLWQFMYTTGKLYKLKINSLVDERRDPIKSTHAAAQFLKDLYDIYGDWTLVIAAYNCGPGNVNKAIKRSGGKTNYWEIYNKLPRETRGYVPAFIAATYTMEYYKDYNIIPAKINYPILTDTIKITQDLHFEQVADVMNIPLRQIQDLNPQYRRNIIPCKTDTFSLLLPYEYTTKFIELQDSIYSYKDSILFSKQTIVKPATYSSESYVPDPPSADMEKVYYTIKSGDNLGYIASWFNVKINDLRYWNNIYRNMIRAGKKLVIYVNKKDVDKYKKIDKMSFEQKQKMIGKTVAKKEDTPKTNNYSAKGKYIFYTVKKGDNFWSIAKKYQGVSNTDIMEINGITDPNSLKPGQKIKIKRIK